MLRKYLTTEFEIIHRTTVRSLCVFDLHKYLYDNLYAMSHQSTKKEHNFPLILLKYILITNQQSTFNFVNIS